MSTRPKYKAPNAGVRDVMRAAKAQHEALRAAIHVDFELEERIQGDSVASEMYKYVRDASMLAAAATSVYDRLRDHVHALAELEGWEHA
jgi:hypothetical protein